MFAAIKNCAVEIIETVKFLKDFKLADEEFMRAIDRDLNPVRTIKKPTRALRLVVSNGKMVGGVRA